ncbi:MAG: MotA/TolQ/ExbB proton channel family protein [Flavobacteriales bacterium]|nr:MotA/TolQ/ExbB proton channel family protein [Flavobacteriales bacterium]MCX7767929.1 MotA/TolQ/ExbB proton channel family protein [Flavobacteriales bacterium]MDW8409333.1 MotA/TolQ/ExbB proton channel family protein [Flavobacteriales bacterium]
MLHSLIAQTAPPVVDTLATIPPSASPSNVQELNLWELTLKGGVIMVPLALLSIIAVYIFVERLLTIRKARQYDPQFMNTIRQYILDGKLEAARTLCQGTNTPVARLIDKGLSRIGRPLNDISAAIENVAKLEIYRLEARLNLLGTIAGAAPMLGFLGTVLGMIKALYNMSHQPEVNISLLSGGIYEAMVTTVGGLIVGIVAYVFYNLLVAQVEKVVNVLEARAIEFMDVLNEPAR